MLIMTNMQSFTKIFIIEIKKETLEQVFSCEFCEISKNTFFQRAPLVAASVLYVYMAKRGKGYII